MIYFNFGIMPMMPFMGMSMYPSFQTGQPNFGIWNMNPCKLMGNFGGRIQLSNYPLEYSLPDIIGCNNAANPFYYSNYFLNTFLLMLNPAGSFQQAQLNARAAQIGSTLGTNAGLNVGISSVGKSVASLKYQVEQALKSDDLTNEQRADLEVCQNQVKELQKRVEKLIDDKNTQSKTTDELMEEIRSIGASCTEISTLKDEILKETSSESTEETVADDGNVAGDGKVAGDDKVVGDDKVDGKDNDGKAKESKKVDDKTNKESSYVARMVVKTGVLCDGIGMAIFVDKKGETHKYTAFTGVSWDDNSAKADLKKRISEYFKSQGFTNVSISETVEKDGIEHPEVSDEDNLNAEYVASGYVYREKLAGTGFGAVSFVDKQGNLKTFATKSGFDFNKGAKELLTQDLEAQIKAAGYNNTKVSLKVINYWP